MTFKLALRNVKRQASSYLIYFITIVFAVSLMFAVNNVLFDTKLTGAGREDYNKYIKAVLGIFIGLTALVVGFIICYASAFLLKIRKKELGTYMLLGMERSKVLKIFVIENLIIGGVSFGFGCLFGLFVFQAFSGIIRAIMGNGFGALNYNFNSVWLTLALWTGIFTAAVIFVSASLKKMTVGELIKDKNSDGRRVLSAKKGMLISIISAVVILLCIALILFCVADIFLTWRRGEPFLEENTAYMLVFIGTIVLAAAVFAFVYFFARSFYLYKINGKNKLKNGGIFHYRRISSALNANGVIMGITAVLLSFAFIITGLYYSARYVSIEQINQAMPYDVIGAWYTDGVPEDWPEDKGTPDEVIAEAEKYSQIAFAHTFYTYDTGVDIYNDEFYTASAIKASDLNRLLEGKGEDIIEIADGEFYVFVDYENTGVNSNRYSFLKEGDVLEFFGEKLKFKGALHSNIGQGYARGSVYFVAVPDAVIENGYEDAAISRILALNSKSYLPQAFYDVFAQYNAVVEGEGFYGVYSEYSNVYSKYRLIDVVNIESSVFITAALFVSLTFMFIAMALLSLKIMSDAEKDKIRFEILGMLGADSAKRKKLLFKMLFAFFAAPLVLPLILSVPAAFMSMILAKGMLGYVPSGIYLIGVLVPLIYIGIFACYLAATYYLLNKSVIGTERPPVLAK